MTDDAIRDLIRAVLARYVEATGATEPLLLIDLGGGWTLEHLRGREPQENPHTGRTLWPQQSRLWCDGLCVVDVGWRRMSEPSVVDADRCRAALLRWFNRIRNGDLVLADERRRARRRAREARSRGDQALLATLVRGSQLAAGPR